MTRCACFNKNGQQCMRDASTKVDQGQNPMYCWQHQNCQTPVVMKYPIQTKKIVKKTIPTQKIVKKIVKKPSKTTEIVKKPSKTTEIVKKPSKTTEIVKTPIKTTEIIKTPIKMKPVLPESEKISPIQIEEEGFNFTIANFNVLNHLHLNKFTKFTESTQESIDRYNYSINILLDYVYQYQIIAVALSEVTDEYYFAFTQLMNAQIEDESVLVFYGGSSLMTVFFNHEKLNIYDIEPVDVEYNTERDRLQIFNLIVEEDTKSKEFTFISIHGYGLPEIREKYLYNTLAYIDQLRKGNLIRTDFLCCGDFNSDLDQVTFVVNKIIKEKGMNDLHVYKNFSATSYHRYILTPSGQFKEKPKALWYSKMDQLLYTDNLTVNSLEIVPHDFTHSEHPYIIVDGQQEHGPWPSDHTLNIYDLNWGSWEAL
jgi:hypothetical protein